MRPNSIVWFERLFLGSVVLGVANMFLHYAVLRDYSISRGGSPLGPIFGIILVMIISLPIWFFIARRASNVAKWITVVLTVLGLFSMFGSYPKAAAISPTYGFLSVVVSLLQAAAVAFLFRKDAVVWLKSKGRDASLDPSVFD